MANHLYDHLFAQHRDNDACFLKPSDDGDVSYREFVEYAARIAHVLVGHGVCPGDRVVGQAPKRWEMLALYAATVQAGAVFLPLNTGYTIDEVSYFVKDATPRIIVGESNAREKLVSLAAEVDASVLTLDADGSGSLTERAKDQPAEFETVSRGPDDLAGLLYTSGTTGRSKGAMMSHNNLLSNAQALVDLWQMSSDDILLHALPVFHTHGLFVAINTSLLAGASIDFMPRFDLDAIVRSLPQSTLMMGVPTFYTRLLEDDRLDHDLVANMRLFISGSAPLLAETHDAFAAKTGHRILERYGMTETNMITSNPYDGARRAGTVGFPLADVELRIADSDGLPTESGDVGMIEVRGPNVFKGYWNMPEKTAEEFRADGFFITGDLGRIDADGYLNIVGRQKDLIITGGYNVYPKELEDILNEIDGVEESAVFGVPDADFGERIIAAIVPTNAAAPDLENIRHVVEAKLARFKHPRTYELMESLPRNTMGKVQKNILRKTHSTTDGSQDLR